MAVVATSVSLAKFHARYANENGYEYWFGEVVQKSSPTWFHAILQGLLTGIFYEQGYYSGSEVDLRISREFQPRPDVAASLDLESGGYPTKPVDIVAEVLSPDDIPERVAEKCRLYATLNIPQIFVFDPVQRTAAQWNRSTQQLETVVELNLRNGATITVQAIFSRFGKRLLARSQTNPRIHGPASRPAP